MKKTGMIAIGVLIVAILMPFTVVSGGGGMEDEVFYNDRGLTHYNRAYYDFLASGRTALADEAFEKAAADFREAIRINGDFVEAYRNLGRVYTVQKKDDLAVEAYRKVVALDPENVENYLPWHRPCKGPGNAARPGTSWPGRNPSPRTLRFETPWTR